VTLKLVRAQGHAVLLKLGTVHRHMSSTMELLLSVTGGSDNPLILKGEAFNEGKGVITSWKEADDKTGAAAVLPLKCILIVYPKEYHLARQLSFAIAGRQ
jgi:hypothetical protein